MCFPALVMAMKIQKHEALQIIDIDRWLVSPEISISTEDFFWCHFYVTTELNGLVLDEYWGLLLSLLELE